MLTVIYFTVKMRCVYCSASVNWGEALSPGTVLMVIEKIKSIPDEMLLPVIQPLFLRNYFFWTAYKRSSAMPGEPTLEEYFLIMLPECGPASPDQEL